MNFRVDGQDRLIASPWSYSWVVHSLSHVLDAGCFSVRESWSHSSDRSLRNHPSWSPLPSWEIIQKEYPSALLEESSCRCQTSRTSPHRTSDGCSFSSSPASNYQGFLWGSAALPQLGIPYRRVHGSDGGWKIALQRPFHWGSRWSTRDGLNQVCGRREPVTSAWVYY